jgi:hypothetical protein
VFCPIGTAPNEGHSRVLSFALAAEVQINGSRSNDYPVSRARAFDPEPWKMSVSDDDVR